MPIVGSDKVTDAAMLEAHWIVDKMDGHRPDILKAMAKNKTRLAVMAYTEFTTDIPEHAHLTSRVFWDRRARGLGATRSAPAVSCAEENVLCHPNDPYSTENICIHEFAHAIHSMGMVDIDPTFDAVKAPKTVQNFVDYVHAGHYSSGEFYRTVTDGNQPNNKIQIAVIQGRANPKAKDKFLAPIPIERTRDTGLKHVDGAISMARETPDTAQDEFFFCIGDQPELDFGGKRNPDGQGFAAFGKISKGMDVVKKIHAANSKEQMLEPAIKIQRAIRLK